MNRNPVLSVIMSVYNTDESYLEEAILSVINQSFKDFEFIIIDDASNSDINQVINKFDDTRIVLLKNKKNLGLAASLNKGIKISKGQYIVRMDADDVCDLERFKKQLDYMNNNYKIDILGSLAKKFGDTKTSEKLAGYAEPDKLLKARLIFNSSLIHPTCMIKKSFLLENNLQYNPLFKKAQDYELWAQCLDGNISVIPEALLHYRVHEKQATFTGGNNQVEYGNKVRVRLIKELGIVPNDEELEIHYELIKSNPSFKHSLVKVDNWCLKLIQANSKSKIFDDDSFKKVIFENFIGYLFKLLRNNKKEISNIIKTKCFYKLLNPIYYKIYFNKLRKVY